MKMSVLTLQILLNIIDLIWEKMIKRLKEVIRHLI